MTPLVLPIIVFASVLGTAWLLWLFRTAPVPAQPASIFAPDGEISPFTRSIGKLSTPTDPAEVDVMRDTLAQAGFPSADALPIYLATRTLLAIVPALLILAIAPPRELAPGLTALLAVSVAGYFLPTLVVRVARAERQRHIRQILPDALDMLVSSLESGLGLDAALQYVARELHGAGPELAKELDVLNAELHAGIPRAEALVRMDHRIGIDEVTSLAGALTQADRYGAGIANSMRAHAQMSRRSRIIDAERRAAEAGPRLTVVMILFILPPLFAVLIGPTVVQVVTEIIPSLEER